MRIYLALKLWIEVKELTLKKAWEITGTVLDWPEMESLTWEDTRDEH